MELLKSRIDDVECNLMYLKSLKILGLQDEITLDPEWLIDISWLFIPVSV